MQPMTSDCIPGIDIEPTQVLKMPIHVHECSSEPLMEDLADNWQQSRRDHKSERSQLRWTAKSPRNEQDFESGREILGSFTFQLMRGPQQVSPSGRSRRVCGFLAGVCGSMAGGVQPGSIIGWSSFEYSRSFISYSIEVKLIHLQFVLQTSGWLAAIAGSKIQIVKALGDSHFFNVVRWKKKREPDMQRHSHNVTCRLQRWPLTSSLW